MSNILFSRNATVSADEAINMIVADARAGARSTYLLIGPPGVGKTQMTYQVGKALDMPVATINVPTLQPEGLCIPVPNHDTGTTADYFNEVWGLHEDVPRVINLDEFTKGNLPIQNTLHTLLEHPRRIGSRFMPEGTVVIATGNWPAVGVGDVLRPHTRNRVIVLPFRSPSSQEWIQWALPNNVHPYVLAFADQNAQLFLSFTDPEFHALDKDDPIRQMVFNPDPANPAKGESYVSPRALEVCSHVIHAWECSQTTGYRVSYGALRAQLQGAIGVPAAEKLLSTIKMGDEVPSAREIMAHVEQRTLPSLRRPTTQAAQMFMALNAPQWLSSAGNGLEKPATRVEVQGRIAAWFQYMQGGFTVPVQAAFVENIRAAAVKGANAGTKIHKLWEVLVTNPEFQRWTTAHSYVY